MGTSTVRRGTASIAWTLGMSLLWVEHIHAEGLNYTLGVSIERSDNINEVATDPISQSVLIPRLNFDWTETGSDLQVQATGQVEYRDYLGGAFDNELRGQLAGVANWIILPQRLSFDFEEYAGVQPVNIFAANAPGNQQQTNVFTLGPTLQFRLGDQLRGVADMRLTDSTASVDKEFDSQRAQAAVHAIRDLNPTDQLSANVEVAHVHYTDAIGVDPDYDRYSVYARYLSKLSEFDLDVALGYSSLDFSAAPRNSGLLAQGKVSWNVTASSRFELGLVRQYADASQDLAIDPATLAATSSGGQLAVGSTQITPQVYLERRVNLAYVYQIPRFNIRIAPYLGNYNYSTIPGDSQFVNGATNQNTHGATLNATYLLRPLWSLGFVATEETRKYTQIDRRDEDLRYGLSLSNQFTRQWSWRADLLRNQRSSTFAGQGFGENLAMLTVIFKR